MSVVAVLKTDTEITVAADSILTKWDAKRNNPKEFTKLNRINGMIIGGCGWAQELSLLWHFMETHKPAHPTVKDVLAFFVEFTKWKSENGDGNEIKNEYIMAFEGHAFCIENLFVYEIFSYDAIGAGEAYSRAALYLGHTPKEAVRTACNLCYLVSEPIIEYTMKIK